MMKFFQKMNIGNLRTTLQEAVIRFPLAVVLSILVSTILFYLTSYENTIDKHTQTILLKAVITGVVSFFLSVSITLFAESEKYPMVRAYLTQGLAILFAIFFYYTLDGYAFESVESIVFICLTLTGFLSLLFVAPFVRRLVTRKYDQDVYYGYFYRTSLVFLFSVIAGGAMMLLGSIAIGSVFALFDLDMLDENKIFMYWMIFSSTLFSPLFALSHVPKKETFTKASVTENKFFTFLIKYIGVPFIYIYFLILYAYSIKVLMNFSDWPKGQITWMVIAFSIFGYKMYIFTHLLRDENTLIKLFRKFFPLVVIPQLFMLFYAIYLRINQYDITMNRYFVVVFGVWLLGISLYYAISKHKYLGVTPFSIGIIILIISVGPWSVYSMPAARQYDRLVNNLEKAHILENGTIKPLAQYTDIDNALSTDIYDGIDYMCDYSECAKIKALFAKELVEKEKQSRAEFDRIVQDPTDPNYRYRDRTYKGLQTYEIVQTISEAIKVRNNWYRDSDTQRYISFHTDYKANLYPIQLDNYQYMVEVFGKEDTKSPEMHADSWIILDTEKKELTVYQKNIVIETIPVAPMIDKILSQGNGITDITLPAESLVFEVKWTKTDIKLLLKNVSIPNPKYVKTANETSYYQYSYGYALVKQK